MGWTAYKTLYKAKYQNTAERTKNTILLDLLIWLYKNKDPNLPPRDALSLVHGYRKLYEERVIRGETANFQGHKRFVEWFLFGAETLHQFLDVLRNPRIPDVGPAAVAITKKIWENGKLPYWEHSNQLTAAELQYQNWLMYRDLEEGLLDGALGFDNPRFREAMDLMLSNDLGVSVARDIDPRKVLEMPELHVSGRITQAFNPDGSLSISLQELRKLSEEEFEKLKNLMGEQLEFLRRLEKEQQVLVTWTMKEDARRLAEEERQRKAEAYQIAIGGAQSTVYLLSTLAGFGDPKLGREIYVVGNAAIQVTDSVVKFADAASKLSGISLGFSSAILAGNIVGAVMNVVSLFQQGPTPEQMILDEIEELQDQVSELRTEMHDRFDRIDQALNAIYETLLERFNQIDVRLGELSGEVQEIQQVLARIESRLSRFTSNTYEWLQASGQRELRTAINGAIDYKELTGENMEFSDYADHENVFHSWATIHAFDELEQDTQSRDYEDDDVLRELDSRALESNIMYLATWLSKQGLPSFATTPLANLRTWAMSARAYVELRSDWPGYAKRISPTRNDRVEEVGEELRSALQRITLGGTSSQPRANRALFELLYSNYGNKYKELDERLHQIERDHLVEWKNGNGRQVAPDIDLWGGAQQQTSYSPESLTTMVSHSPPLVPAAPNNIITFVAPPHLLGDYLWVDRPGLTVHYDCSWENMKTRRHPRDPGIIVSASAELQIFITVQYQGTTILRRSVKGDRVDLMFTPEEMLESPQDGFWRLWEREQNLKARFEAGSAEVLPTEQERVQREQHLSTVTGQVESELQEHQEQIYTRTSEELRVGPLHDAALRLSGAKALLDAFINLGMPLALESDDYLRAFLNGSQSLPDAEQVSERYASAQGGDPNVRIEIFQDADRRVYALYWVLMSYLDQIERGARTESEPLLSSTLLRSSVINRIVRLADASDNTPPETTITSAPPSGSTTGTSAAFEFSSSEPNSTFLCQLDDAPLIPCSPPVSYDSLSPGTHTFRVKAIDDAGNIATTPTSRTWIVEETVT
jgi:hypothetical protein